MSQIAAIQKTKPMFLFCLTLLIWLSGCVEKMGRNGSGGNFFINAVEMAQAGGRTVSSIAVSTSPGKHVIIIADAYSQAQGTKNNLASKSKKG